jgi:hypothetical protein
MFTVIIKAETREKALFIGFILFDILSVVPEIRNTLRKSGTNLYLVFSIYFRGIHFGENHCRFVVVIGCAYKSAGDRRYRKNH